MNVVKCINGHFFDGEIYTTCPHCGAPVGNSIVKEQTEQKNNKKGHGLFGRKTKDGNITGNGGGMESRNDGYFSNFDAGNYADNNAGGFGNGNTPTQTMDTPVIIQEPQKEQKKDVTLDFWQKNSESNRGGEQSVQAMSEEILKADADPIPDQKSPEEPRDDINSSEKRTESLIDKVNQASANSEGKTMSYFSAVTSEMSAPDIQQHQIEVKAQSDPVVGWLVCIKGEHFGESFSITAGMNSIGRYDTNKIVISKDNSVSRDKHALITYEPKYRKFYVKPGDSSGLTYVNEEYITESRQIVANDIIELGNSRFLFVPLCGENFSWEDYLITR